MTRDRSEMDVFLEALDLDTQARAAFLEALGDERLASRVARLLAAHEELGDEDPIFARPETRPTRATPESLIGTAIGGYVLVSIIGRGGMGVVYEARQLEPERSVAIKILSHVLHSDDAVARFEREGRFLARLQHPGIAHVYGVGRAADQGDMPYLVMELIRGEPIDAYCSRRRLSIEDKARMLAEVAETVAHVHTRGVVHRDLKPGNILVDEAGRSRILDFGIARLDDGESERDSLQTRAGQILGTLPYMSPEQVSGDQLAVDGRSDVYALGCIAYEILSGRRPLDIDGDNLPSAIRRITEEEPRPIGGIEEDLETIVSKSLRKRPDERYGSAAELAADLRRFLDHEPIAARPASRVYRFAKMIRRHRVLVAGIVTTIVALIFGATWALIERGTAIDAELETHKALRAEETARKDSLRSAEAATTAALRERARADSLRRMNSLVSEIVSKSTLRRNRGQEQTVSELVDELAAKADGTFPDDSYVTGCIHLMLANARVSNGNREAAILHLERARESFEASPLTDDADWVEFEYQHADSHLMSIDSDRHLERLRELLPKARAYPDGGKTERRAARALSMRLVTNRTDLDEALELARHCVDLGIRIYGPKSDSAARDIMHVAFVLCALDRRREAIDEYRRAVELRREIVPDSLDLASALDNLGNNLQIEARYAEAMEVSLEAIAIRRKIYAETPHVELAIGLDNLGSLYRDHGRIDEALALFEEAEVLFRRIHGDTHPDLAICLTEFAAAYRAKGRRDDARRAVDEAIAIHERIGGRPTPAQAATLELAGHLALDRDEPRKALELAEEAEDIRVALHGPTHHLVARPLVILSSAHLLIGDLDEAIESGRKVMSLRGAHFGPDHWVTWESAELVLLPLAKRGEFAEARKLAEKACQALEAGLGPENPKTRNAHLTLQAVIAAEMRKD